MNRPDGWRREVRTVQLRANSRQTAIEVRDHCELCAWVSPWTRYGPEAAIAYAKHVADQHRYLPRPG